MSFFEFMKVFVGVFAVSFISLFGSLFIVSLYIELWNLLCWIAKKIFNFLKVYNK